MSFAPAAFGTATYGYVEVDYGAQVSFATALTSPNLTYVVEIGLAAQVFDEAPIGYGVAPFGVAPYGWADAYWVSTSGDEDILRFSDRSFITATTDDPSSTFIDPRLLQPMRLARGIQLAPTVSADGAQTAVIELYNGDGGLDSAVINSAIDGRPVRVLAGLFTSPLSSFETVWLGVARAWEQGDTTVQIEAYDASYMLDQPVQPTNYAGTGTYEGTSDLAGTPKPLAMGQCFNVDPVLIDFTNLVYQVHDGPVESITVYEGGVAVTAEGDVLDIYTGTTTAGQYRTDLSRGLFQLGSSPTQRITADVEGDKPEDDVYSTGIGTITHRLMTLRSGLATRYIDAGSFNSLDAAALGICGVYIRDSETARSVLDRLLGGVAATWTCSRDGKLKVYRLTEPNTAAAVRTFDTLDILSIRTLRLPDQVFPPVWRVTVGYKQNYTVLIDEDLSGSITEARRQDLGLEWRTVQDSDGAIRTRHLRATTLGMVESPLQVEADALTLAESLLDLHSYDRRLIEVTVPAIGQTIEMGDTVQIIWPRMGLGVGKYFRAFPIEEDSSARTVTMMLWGPQTVEADVGSVVEEEVVVEPLIAAHTFLTTVPGHTTYTRTGTATEYNASGVMEFHAADVPRFAYVAGVSKGIRLEGERTNLVTYSEAMNNAAWNGGGFTGNVTVDQALAPWQEGA